MLKIAARSGEHGHQIVIKDERGVALFEVATPVILEALSGAGAVNRTSAGYDTVSESASALQGRAEVRGPRGRYVVVDAWRVEDDGVHLHRQLTGGADGEEAVRLVLEATAGPHRLPFGEARVFAPPALYDLNDIDQDGEEDYLDTRTLVYRDDRLTGLAVLAYSPADGRGYSLVREDLPTFDDIPERERGQLDFVQRTDIGALGVSPADGDGTLLIAAYPFVERDRSNALTSEEREPWGAFWRGAGAAPRGFGVV
jgi:hypothetical protein